MTLPKLHDDASRKDFVMHHVHPIITLEIAGESVTQNHHMVCVRYSKAGTRVYSISPYPELMQLFDQDIRLSKDHPYGQEVMDYLTLVGEIMGWGVVTTSGRYQDGQ